MFSLSRLEKNMRINEELARYEAALTVAPRVKPLSSNGWASRIPRESGVYVVWQNNVPYYVGETSSLRLRMSDLARPVNHTFSKKVAKALDIPENEYTRLASAISARYELSCVPVAFGRKEVEEYLILRWRESIINKPTKRLLHSTQYNWVEPANHSLQD